MIRLSVGWSSGAVLQHGQPQSLCGTAAPKQLLRVTLQSQHKLYQVETHTDAQGVFSVDIPPQPPSGPWTCTITLADVVLISLHDLWFGQLLLFAGQSNVGWPLARYPDQLTAALQLSAADALWNVRCYVADAADMYAAGQWLQQNSISCPQWPALLYHFSREYAASTLSSQTPVMLGLVDLSWPGSAIDAWIPSPMLDSADWHRAAKPWQPGALFAAKLAPWLQQPFHALIWYQGEQNAMGHEADLYGAKLRKWLDGCRQLAGWDFPLLLVQIAGFGTSTQPDPADGFVLVRQAQQLVAASSINCALICAADLGTERDIHPPYKAELARRLALALNALLSNSAPLLQAALHGNGSQLFLRLPLLNATEQWQVRTAGGDLITDNQVQGFSYSTDRQHWHAAAVTLDAERQQLSLQLPGNAQWLAYGYAAMPVLHLYTTEGLPLLPQLWQLANAAVEDY